MIKFSPTEGLFYDTSFGYSPPIPEDAMEITVAQFQAALVARSEGRALSYEEGEIVAGEVPTAEQATPHPL